MSACGTCKHWVRPSPRSGRTHGGCGAPVPFWVYQETGSREERFMLPNEYHERPCECYAAEPTTDEEETP